MLLVASNRAGAIVPDGAACRLPAVNDIFNPFPTTAFNHMPIGSGAAWTAENAPANVDLRRGIMTININNVHAGDLRQAAPDDPLVTVRHRTSGAVLVTIRMPPNWPAWGTTNSGDRPTTIYDPVQNIAWCIYHFNRTGLNTGVYDTNAKQIFLTNALGTGNNPVMSTSASRIPHCGVQYWAGDWSDNTPGGLPYIEHALHLICARKTPEVMQLSKTFQYPAYGVDGDALSNPDFNNGNIPYGAAFALPMPEFGGPPDSVFAALNFRQMRYVNTLRRYPMFVVDGTGEPKSATRGFGVWTQTMKTDLQAAFMAMRPYLRMIGNTAQGQTAWGGGAPLAPNCAHNSGAPRI